MISQSADEFFAALEAADGSASVAPDQGLRKEFPKDEDFQGRLNALLKDHAEVADLEYAAVLTDEGYRLGDYGSRRYLQAERDSLGVLAVGAMLSARKLGQGLAGVFHEMCIACPPFQAFVWGLDSGCVILNVAKQAVPSAILRLACRRAEDRLNQILRVGSEAQVGGRPPLWEVLDMSFPTDAPPEPMRVDGIKPLFVPAVTP